LSRENLVATLLDPVVKVGTSADAPLFSAGAAVRPAILIASELKGRALPRAVAAEDAAVPGERAKERFAALAFMEELARVQRHLKL